MSFFTDKKTLLVGAISLMSSVSAVMLTTQPSSKITPFFTQSGSTPQMVVNQNLREEQSYILQGLGRDALVAAVEKVGGAVAREFPIINAISAYLTASQASEIASVSGIQMTEDRNVMTMSSSVDYSNSAGSKSKKFAIDTFITSQTDADKLHDFGITGRGITVAVLDSGTLMGGKQGRPLLKNSMNRSRAFYKYDAQQGIRTRLLNDDENGHGSHVSGIIASSLQDDKGNFNGMAPDVYLLSIKAFDASGSGSYTDVLDGLNYIYQNRMRYRIRVVNLSLGAAVQSHYWDDPINQAIMRLWDAGVVVVTSAGNSGSDLGTVTVPGNNPYVITVGAVTDAYTEHDFSDDRITTFSSQGPTYEGFVKPEVVAFGGHVRSKMNKALLKNKNFVADDLGEDYHRISGTSQAAAVVTGTVALMLQYNPHLSPDDVKCRLMDSAEQLEDPENGETYGPLTQGSGLINAYDAVMSRASGCANIGMDIQADLNGITHYRGPVGLLPDGSLAIELNDGTVLTEGTSWGETFMGAMGTEWKDNMFNVMGTEWGEAGFTFSVLGTAWGDNGELGLLGTDWTDLTNNWNSMFGLEGTAWGDVNAEGTDWGDNNTWGEGTAWGVTVSVESVVGATVDESEIDTVELTETSDELLDIDG